MQQPQMQMKFLPTRNYFNKRYLCQVMKKQKTQYKFTTQMCPNSVRSESAEVKKSTNMPTSTATTATTISSYRNFQQLRRSSNRKLADTDGSINGTSGAIRTKSEDSTEDNANNNNNNSSISDSKNSPTRRIIAITSGHILLTMLLSSAIVLKANYTVAAPTDATQSPAKTTNTLATNIISFFNTSTDNLPAARTADRVTGCNATTKDITAPTETVTPKTSSTTSPSLPLISSPSTIANAGDALAVAQTMLSAPALHPPSHPHPSSYPHPSPVLTPQPTSNSLPSLATTTILPTCDLPVELELFTMEPVMGTTVTVNENVENHSVGLQPPPSSDVLIKGFSIPTFLPPYPAFAMADLPAYTMPPTSVSAPVTPTVSTDSQDQLYLAAYQQNALQHNLSMPSINITVQMGNHAYLPCNLHSMLNKPISWVRLRDGHILSVDQATFIADQRFQSIFQGEDEYTWSLQIKYVQDADEGWYECQLSTEPKMSAKVYLGVVVPHTELIGDQNRFVKAGSKVALHCIVRDTLDPPTYIIWLRGKTQITNDNKWGWYTEIDRAIFGNADSNRNTIGSLIIPFVRKKDSGNYTCQPSNSAPVSVDLHVLSGEYSASAIMSAASSYWVSGSSPSRFLLSLVLLVVPKT